MVLSTAKRQNRLSIDIHDHRYYYPGDTIHGNVTLHLTKPTKTFNIRLTLSAEIQSLNKSVQLLSQTQLLAQSPLNDGKAHLLPPKTHRFSFEFRIPDDKGPLPSSMKLAKLATVRYFLTALHDRPLVPDTLALQYERSIPVLELIDVDSPSCSRKALTNHAVLEPSATSRKSQISISVPKPAIVRGDVVPVMITIKHGQSLKKDNAIEIQLLRNVYIQRHLSDGIFEKGRLLDQTAINTNTLNIHLVPGLQNEFTQILKTRIMIPTHTPPTVGNSGRIFSIEYVVRATINLNNSGTGSQSSQKRGVLSLPVIIGTFPKADLSIDDDEDEEADDAFNHMDELASGDGQDASDTLEAKLKALNISSISLTSPNLPSVPPASTVAAATQPTLAAVPSPTFPSQPFHEHRTRSVRQTQPPATMSQAPISGSPSLLISTAPQSGRQQHVYMNPRPYLSDRPHMEPPLPPSYFITDRGAPASRPPRAPYPTFGYHSGIKPLPVEPALPGLVRRDTISSTYSRESSGSATSYERDQDSPSSATHPYWPSPIMTPNYRPHYSMPYHDFRAMSAPALVDVSGNAPRPSASVSHSYHNTMRFHPHGTAPRPSLTHYAKAPMMQPYGLASHAPPVPGTYSATHPPPMPAYYYSQTKQTNGSATSHVGTSIL